MLEGQLPWLPNIAKFGEMFFLILGKLSKKPLLVPILRTTFKHSKEWWRGRVEEILHQTISFAFSNYGQVADGSTHQRQLADA